MRLPSYLTLTISLTAALALAVPALAQAQDPERPPEAPVTPVTPTNPVEDCLELLPEPDQEQPVGTDDSDTADGTEFAACVLEALTDVAGTTHAAAIVAMVGAGIATGYPDGTFRPADRISRAQMATMLDAALDLDPSVSGELPDDVDPDSVHADAIAAILEAGISQGRADGSFGPNDPVSRGQMAAFLDNAGLVDELSEGVTVELPEDVKGTVHEDAIAGLLGNGIARGFNDGTFRPADAVNRGQMATFIITALGLDHFQLPELP